MTILMRGKDSLLRTVGFVALVAECALGQASVPPPQSLNATAQLPAFEVASIRPSKSDSTLLNFMISPTRFRVENGTVTALIRFAYNIKSDDQLPKEPGWIGTERFDIDAEVADSQVEAMKTMIPDMRFEQYRMMMQSLLADRFKLQSSQQMKELPVFALVVAKSGPKLTRVDVSLEPQMQHMPTLSGGSRGALAARAVSMALFTNWLSGRDDIGGRVVVDETGLAGSYDFTLNWTLDSTRAAMSSANSASQGPGTSATQESAGPSILTAIQEQLGLKLESTKAKVEALVINHVEWPSEN
jgi:uncharacterized protein (TIGR03435 family)